MATIHLVLNREEPVRFLGVAYPGLFEDEAGARRLKKRLLENSQNHKIHVGVMEPPEQLPNHIRELVGTWHKGGILRQKNAKVDREPARGFGHTNHTP